MLKILMVEDNSSDIELINTYLNRAGMQFEMSIASDKQAFEEAIEQKTFDVILCDHAMPGFNSLEALQEIKSKGLNTPFILLSGTITEEFAIQITKEGADDYILKDHFKRLPLAINKAMENRKLKLDNKLLEKKLEGKIKEIRKSFLSIINS